MSRQLPDRPNLDHLKKQAKALLDDLKTRDPEAQLADALHALARDYGFPSWPKLKVHVEAGFRHQSPFNGRWQADIARSRRHPANQFQSATIDFEVLDDRVMITHAFVEESGRPVTGVHTLLVDGEERATADGSDYTLVARWRTRNVIEVLAKKDGAFDSAGTYEVSDDGGTLTVTAPDQLIVLTR